MLKKIIFLIFLLLNFLHATSYEKGEKIFRKKCSTCHKGYIPLKTLKKNFFEFENKLLNLKAPTENLLAYAILDGSKKIGLEDDEEIRQIEIEEYLKSYLKKPNRFNSICYDDVLQYYDNKKSMNNELDEEDYVSLSYFFLDYKKHNYKEDKRKHLSSKSDIKSYAKEAKEKNKKILVYATSKDCYFCKKMDKEVFNLERIKNMINKNYIFIKIDVFDEALPFSLEKEYKRITPSFFFLSKDKKYLKQYPGSWNGEDFLDILKENIK